MVLDHIAIATFDAAAETLFRRWLTDEVLPREPRPAVLEDEINAWLAGNRIVRPGTYRLDRIVRSASSAHDATALRTVAGRLTACASGSKHFGAFDQNLMTEWHVRYGGRGVMIYWHVERDSVCIYSRLKRCSSSEVSAMIEEFLKDTRNAYYPLCGDNQDGRRGGRRKGGRSLTAI